MWLWSQLNFFASVFGRAKSMSDCHVISPCDKREWGTVTCFTRGTLTTDWPTVPLFNRPNGAPTTCWASSQAQGTSRRQSTGPTLRELTFIQVDRPAASQHSSTGGAVVRLAKAGSR